MKFVVRHCIRDRPLGGRCERENLFSPVSSCTAADLYGDSIALITESQRTIEGVLFPKHKCIIAGFQMVSEDGR